MPRGFEAIMIRKLLVVLLVLLPSIPALAKSDRDYYPISCDVLWTAVKSTLNNPADYNVLVSDDLSHRAAFVVVGDLTVFKDVVILKSRDMGCSIKLAITQIGSDNSNERSFRGRLKRTLARMQRPQPTLPIGGISTASAAGTPAQAPAAPASGAPAKPQMTPKIGVEAIWASTVSSRVVLSHPAESTPNRKRTDEKPSMTSAGPAGY
jgi:hypothetical protein